MSGAGGGDYTSVDEVWRYYQSSLAVIDYLFTELRGPKTGVQSNNSNPSLLGVILMDLPAMRQELDYQTTMAMIASVEGAFLLDYESRTTKGEKPNKRKKTIKGKDALSRALRDLRKELADQRPKLEEILERWKACHPSYKNQIGNLVGWLGVRHWLAHGRYWTLKAGGRRPDPEALRAFLSDLQTKLRGCPY